jgi:hypothetical protein
MLISHSLCGVTVNADSPWLGRQLIRTILSLDYPLSICLHLSLYS